MYFRLPKSNTTADIPIITEACLYIWEPIVNILSALLALVLTV